VLREYDAKKDRVSARRIWREVGWVQDKEQHLVELDRFIASGSAFVAEVNGEAECLVSTVPGTMRYISHDLPLCAVTSVATGRAARKQGLATALSARAVARAAAEGALVCGLGVFEQGFYNQLGFGSGGYEHSVSFDPGRLVLDTQARTARRLEPDDWEAAHRSRVSRMRRHGGINLTPPDVTRAEMVWSKNGFGLGYGSQGELTHSMWCEAKNVEHGPYRVHWVSYRTPAQFLELAALLRSLGDQIRLVQLREPPGIQLEDLLKQPMRERQLSRSSLFESANRGLAYWQARIVDLPGCLQHTCLQADQIRFNLALSDPIVSFLDEAEPWKGVAGDYVVTLGPSSGAEPGVDSTLPTLRASVGAFTRLWLGVRPATGLAVTDDLSGPPSLLDKLDWTLLLPDPKPDWDF
jgi:GNAT superfamily N-acetyltransferase